MQRPCAHRRCMEIVSGVLVKLCHRGAAVSQGYALIYSKSVSEKQEAWAGQKLLPKAIYRPRVWSGMRSKLFTTIFRRCLKRKQACFLSHRADWDGLDKADRSEDVGGLDSHKVQKGRGARWDLWFRRGAIRGWQIAFFCSQMGQRRVFC